MKKVIIFIFIIGITLNLSFAENISPVALASVKLSEKSIEVSFPKATSEMAYMKIYSCDFNLLHTSTLSGKIQDTFDISTLGKGYYIVSIEMNGESVYTKAIEVEQ